MKVRRRRFLEASAAGLVMASWPGFIREAFGAQLDATCPQGEPPSDSTSSCEALLSAHGRASADDRPLLVIVIPKEAGERHWRGSLFGGLINWGDDDALAALGLCEVVCATLADLRTLVPESESVQGEPLAVLIETEYVASELSVIDGNVRGKAAEPDSFLWDDRAFSKAQARLAVLLREGVAANPARAYRLREPAEVAQLAKQARAVLKDRRVPGSKWATSTGCGTEVEALPGEEDLSQVYACGMGHVPAKAQRMLHFFVDQRRG